MAEYADLEIGLRWNRGSGGFDVSLRFDASGSNVDDARFPDAPLPMDLGSLTRQRADERGYGDALTQMLFGPADIRSFYSRCHAAAEERGVPLHVRLRLDAPPRYHAVRWESLRDPNSGTPIALRPDVLFSRYLSSTDWRSIPAHAPHELRSLVVIANPSDLDALPSRRPLEPVNVAGELARARDALQGHRVEELTEPGAATLSNILDRIDKSIDVLYLVCHGTISGEVPSLVLEAPDGTADIVDGRDLVEGLAVTEHRPTLVMLCSCQSAGPGDSGGAGETEAEASSQDGGALSALGPRLAAAGVAAVVAMQGDITMRTASAFMPAFFQALGEDGVVDRAMAAARRVVSDRVDWWVPVLFSRLRSGRTYYRPGFPDKAAQTWSNLALQARSDLLTPVVGPGLADAILGTRGDIARRWVHNWQMPIAAHHQGDLVTVAQYLRVRHAVGTVRSQMRDYLKTEIRERSKHASPTDPFHQLPEALLTGNSPELAILEVGRRLREHDPNDPYRALAALPVSVYVTTGWTDLLQAALEASEPKRLPTTMSFPWNGYVADTPTLTEEPTVDRPLVYHLFGRLDDLDSLVLTEDDHFEWLSAWIARRTLLPRIVGEALTRRSLMFLGYALGDWDFRVVFHSLKTFGGRVLLLSNNHVGVQLTPENQALEPEAAQEYLESYLGDDKVNVYWGTPRRFLKEFGELGRFGS